MSSTMAHQSSHLKQREEEKNVYERKEDNQANTTAMPKTTTSTTTIQIHTHTQAKKKGNEMAIFVAAFVQMECPIR